MEVKDFADFLAEKLGEAHKRERDIIMGGDMGFPIQAYPDYRQAFGHCLGLREADIILRQAYKEWLHGSEKDRVD